MSGKIGIPRTTPTAVIIIGVIEKNARSLDIDAPHVAFFPLLGGGWVEVSFQSGTFPAEKSMLHTAPLLQPAAASAINMLTLLLGPKKVADSVGTFIYGSMGNPVLVRRQTRQRNYLLSYEDQEPKVVVESTYSKALATSYSLLSQEPDVTASELTKVPILKASQEAFPVEPYAQPEATLLADQLVKALRKVMYLFKEASRWKWKVVEGKTIQLAEKLIGRLQDKPTDLFFLAEADIKPLYDVLVAVSQEVRGFFPKRRQSFFDAEDFRFRSSEVLGMLIQARSSRIPGSSLWKKGDPQVLKGIASGELSKSSDDMSDAEFLVWQAAILMPTLEQIGRAFATWWVRNQLIKSKVYDHLSRPNRATTPYLDNFMMLLLDRTLGTNNQLKMLPAEAEFHLKHWAPRGIR